MKKLVAIMVIIFSILKVNANPETVQIAYIDSDYLTYDDNTYSGYAYELLTHIKDTAGVNFVYSKYEENNLPNYDIIFSKTATANSTYLFSVRHTLKTSLENDIYFLDYQHFSDKTVGVLRDDDSLDRLFVYAREHQLNLKYLYYDNITDLNSALSKQEVSLAYCNASDLSNFKIVDYLDTDTYYLNFLSDDTNNLAVKKALNYLSNKKLSAIQSKYFNNDLAYPLYTRSEIEYVEELKTINVFVFANREPFCYLTKQGVTGLEIDYFNKLANLLGVRFNYLYLPNDFPKADIVSNIEADTNLDLVSYDNMNTSFITMNDFNKTSIATIDNSGYLEYLHVAYPDKKIIKYNDYNDLVTACYENDYLGFGNDIILKRQLAKPTNSVFKLISSDYIYHPSLLVANDNMKLQNIINKTVDCVNFSNSENNYLLEYDDIITFEDFLSKYKWQFYYTILTSLLIVMILILFNIRKNKYLHKIDQKNIALNQALIEASKAYEVKDNFISRMSHELRTPLNIIISYTNKAKQKTTNDEVKKYLEKAEIGSEELLQTFNDVLDIQSVKNNHLLLKEEYFDLQDLCNYFENFYSILSRENKTKWELSYQVKNNIIYADKQKLKQIINNLLSNAFKFSKGKEVNLIIREKKSTSLKAFYEIIIRDTGIGIDKDKVQQIFLPFRQETESTFYNYGGSGIGLSVVNNLVKLMNGKIRVVTEKNKGSEFILNFSFKIQNRGFTYSNYKLEKKHILLVEDNPLNAEICKAILEEYKAEVMISVSGEEAIDSFQKSSVNEIDIILLDVILPKFNGFEVAKKIRSLNRLDAKKILIIGLSSNSVYLESDKAILSGMDGYIQKPLSYEKLINEINIILGKRN